MSEPGRRGFNWVAARDGVGIAIDALRSNKARSFLTILGIVIGVATVMAMAALVGGIRGAVTEDLEALGPENFIVDRWDQTKLVLVDHGTNPPWWGKPPITAREAGMIERLSSIESVTEALDTQAEIRYGSQSIEGVQVLGRGAEWTEYSNGTFPAGRNYLPNDERAATPVVVLSVDLARTLLGGVDPVGKRVRLGGELFQVVGTYELTSNPFASAMKNWAIVPHTTAIKRLNANPNRLSLLVVPASGVGQAEAMDHVASALRTARGLAPGEENDFALIRQEAFGEMFDQITGVFFLVMLVLSSIGLMVGGVGVVAIMMISVTERTREIGVRKALGATRREILWQFLVESMTVTVIGGLIGMLLGGAGAFALASFTPVPAAVPLWSVAAALGMSAITGIGFGLYPANKAARLDPVDALRYE